MTQRCAGTGIILIMSKGFFKRNTVNSFTIRHLRKRWYSKNFGHSPSRLGCKSRDSETKFLEMD